MGHGLEGDGQGDLRAHGGHDKAVYGYPSEHLPVWRQILPDLEPGPGTFGENLSFEGLLEDEVRIGDLFRIGTAELRVTEPRFPCATLVFHLRRLGVRRMRDRSGEIGPFDETAFLREFLESRRTGIYFAIEREGVLRAGDDIERIERGAAGLTIAEVVRLHQAGASDAGGMRRALENRHLPERWKDRFRAVLAKGREAESP